MTALLRMVNSVQRKELGRWTGRRWNRPLQPKLEQGKRCEKCHVDIKLPTRSRSTRVEAVERHDEVSVVVGPLEALVVVNA